MLTKIKRRKHNPLKISNCSIGCVLGLVRENILRTDIPKVLINLLKYKSRYAFIDKDVEDYSVHLLKVLIQYVTNLKKVDKTHELLGKLNELLSEESDFFTNLQNDSSYSKLTHAYIDFLDNDSTDIIEQQEKAKQDKTKELKDKKKMMAKRKAQAMMKMAKKRSIMIGKCGLETETSSNCDSASLLSDKGDEEAPK